MKPVSEPEASIQPHWSKPLFSFNAEDCVDPSVQYFRCMMVFGASAGCYMSPDAEAAGP